MKKYLLIDSYNLFFRAMYGVKNNKNTDIHLKRGMLLHTLFSMLKKACEKFSPDHIVIVADGKGTWRKDIYPAYKLNRLEKYQEKTIAEIELEKDLKTLFEETFLDFMKNNTNCTYLQYDKAEADDLIARFIKLHDNNAVIILSTDNDFVQLLSDNVIIYNSMEDRIITKSAVLTADKKQPLRFTLKEGKISVPKINSLFQKNEHDYVPFSDWTEYALFLKCIKGDKSDNIFSAYPRITEKSTKTKIGIRDAFLDRDKKGYDWQSFMNSEWEDPMGKKHIVKDEYEFNKRLIDLNMIPIDLKEKIDEHIKMQQQKEYNNNIYYALNNLFVKWSMLKMQESSTYLTSYFGKPYIE